MFPASHRDAMRRGQGHTNQQCNMQLLETCRIFRLRYERPVGLNWHDWRWNCEKAGATVLWRWDPRRKTPYNDANYLRLRSGLTFFSFNLNWFRTVIKGVSKILLSIKYSKGKKERKKSCAFLNILCVPFIHIFQVYLNFLFI